MLNHLCHRVALPHGAMAAIVGLVVLALTLSLGPVTNAAVVLKHAFYGYYVKGWPPDQPPNCCGHTLKGPMTGPPVKFPPGMFSSNGEAAGKVNIYVSNTQDYVNGDLTIRPPLNQYVEALLYIDANTTFQVVVQPRLHKHAPNSIKNIPVITTAISSVTCSPRVDGGGAHGTTDATATISIQGQIPVIAACGVATYMKTNTKDFFTINTPIMVNQLVIGEMVLDAEACVLLCVGEVSGAVYADVDPSFEIDPSFQYADDFQLAYSPGYLSASSSGVPDPPSWLLLASGLGVLASWRAFRRRPSSQTA